MLEVIPIQGSPKRASQAVKRKYNKDNIFKRQKRLKSKIDGGIYMKRTHSYMSSHKETSDHGNEISHLPDFIFKIIKLKNFINSSANVKSNGERNEELWSLLMSGHKKTKHRNSKNILTSREYLRMASKKIYDRSVICPTEDRNYALKKGIDNLKNHVKVFDQFLRNLDQNVSGSLNRTSKAKKKKMYSSSKVIPKPRNQQLGLRTPSFKSFSADSYLIGDDNHTVSLTRKTGSYRFNKDCSNNDGSPTMRNIKIDSKRKFNRHSTMRKLATMNFKKKVETPKINIISVESFGEDLKFSSSIEKTKENQALPRRSKLVPLELIEKATPQPKKEKVQENKPRNELVKPEFNTPFKTTKKRALCERKKQFHSKCRKEIKRFDKILELKKNHSQDFTHEEKTDQEIRDRTEMIQRVITKDMTSSIEHDISIRDSKVDRSIQNFNRIYKNHSPVKLYQTNYSQKMRNRTPKLSLSSYKSYEGPGLKPLKSKSKVAEFINHFYTKGRAANNRFRSYQNLPKRRLNAASPEVQLTNKFPKLMDSECKQSNVQNKALLLNKSHIHSNASIGGISALLNAFSPIKERDMKFRRKCVRPLFTKT
ncbi:unnamed protein product [Moneuplotes crassus]|uniref:Uncharacterized protein n=1 Tax=Euplotes crassus TaxID=5936 RepID=A0AAD1X6Y1_EUPCR|nr:unnamed protein product [Moneuplotes crassus]